jgi:hypothetical protein
METRPLLKHKGILLFTTALLPFFLLPFFGSDTVWSQPKIVRDARPGDCIACHGDGKVLSKNHPGTTTMDLKTCKTCHKDEQAEGKLPVSLAGRLPLSHMHTLGGIDCKACHGEQLKPLGADNCLTCHEDYKAGGNRLNTSLPKVHDSHMGDLSCDLCHKAHGKSVNFCSQCHDWKYKVP